MNRNSKILIVDDKYGQDVTRMLLDVFKSMSIKGEFIETVPAQDEKMAIEIIKQNPEADKILLDGAFQQGNCLDVVSQLDEFHISKIICFAGDVDKWKNKLLHYGVRHFPGKDPFKIICCMAGDCLCGENPPE